MIGIGSIQRKMAYKMLRYTALSFLCFIVFAAQAAAPTSVQSPAATPEAQAQSAQAFVQGFYDWYIAKGGSPPDAALANKRWPMSEQIVTALKADEAAQAKSPGYIVGIDMDPFLNAQDTCFPYKAGKVLPDGHRYRVELFDSNCSDPHPEIPTVIAVVEPQKGSWVFVNFIYPGEPGQADDDLLTMLKALKEDREQHTNHDPN